MHGSSNPDHAWDEIKNFFGELQFNPDGSIAGGEGVADGAGNGEEAQTQGDTAQDGNTVYTALLVSLAAAVKIGYFVVAVVILKCPK